MGFNCPKPHGPVEGPSFRLPAANLQPHAPQKHLVTHHTGSTSVRRLTAGAAGEAAASFSSAEATSVPYECARTDMMRTPWGGARSHARVQVWSWTVR